MTKKLTTEFVKKEYNRQIREDYRGNYEYERWFSNKEAKLGYDMHQASQRYYTNGIVFHNYFEFGPGPGTWTKMFINNYSQFTLLDISSEMLKQVKKSLGTSKNINYRLGNILELNEKNKFDFVFSSRAIKYVPNKKRLFEVLYSAMSKNGTCIIINQSYDTLMQRICRLFGLKQNDLLHSKGITIIDLKQILVDAGFKDIRFYPVEIKVGIPGVIIFRRLSFFLWKLLYKRELNFVSTLLSGSYLVRMKK